ncbi:MAG TPA: hypothetical protein VH092_06700 [Urbifossiella sp.]|jgi:hypothetical protein|nr:hypothetical protein [Urbifossiella sp.]
MAIKSILLGLFLTGVGLFIAWGGFQCDPIIWEAVFVGGVAVPVSPLVIWWGIGSPTRHRPKKTDTALDALDAASTLLK